MNSLVIVTLATETKYCTKTRWYKFTLLDYLTTLV
jgi:hypothetical protein